MSLHSRFDLSLTQTHMRLWPPQPRSLVAAAVSQLHTLLVANRGEIAVRILRAAAELDVRTADEASLHVALAGQALAPLRCRRTLTRTGSPSAPRLRPGETA